MPGIKKVLLVEDEAVSAMIGERNLRHCGYEVVVAAAGEAAVDMALADSRIDLVLLDIDLGKGIDGTEAAVRILEQRDLPIVFMSNHTEPEVVALTEKITAYGYVVKNCGITILDASLKMAFRLFEANSRTQAINHQLEATFAALPDQLYEFDLDGICHEYHSPRCDVSPSLSGIHLGKSLAEILSTEAADIVLGALNSAHEQNACYGTQFSLDEAHGQRWFEISVSSKKGEPDDPRFIVISRDITERRRVEEDLRIHQIELSMQNEELKQTQRQLEALKTKYYDLYVTAPLAHATIAENGVVLEANAAAAAQLGVPLNQLVKQPFTSFISTEDQDLFYRYRKSVLENAAPADCALRLKHQDASPFPVRLHSSLARLDGDLSAFHLVWHADGP